MKRRAWLRYIFAVMLLQGCRFKGGEQPFPGIEKFGLTEAIADRPTILSATAMANTILGRDARVVFTPAWRPGEASRIPVYPVTSAGLGKREVMATYSECRCIISRPSAIPNWLTDHVGSSDALLTTDVTELLAYMLLHEGGHIVNKDTGVDFFSPMTSASSQFNLDATAQKDRERRADAFAANAIRSGLKQSGTERGLDAAKVATTLTKLAWNLSAHRLLDNFGGTAVHARSLFWDAGLSHPNLEWRILSVNNMIDSSETSRKLLNDFEAERQG